MLAHIKRLLAAAIAGILAIMPVHGVQTEAPAAKQVAINALFAPWQTPASPGCALSVTEKQQLVFKAAYGSAILDVPTPNTPDTSFHVASISKQFTAFAIHLLQSEGKLSLQDDVRKYVPELHDFGPPIRLANLLHHTSGLRDQWSLLVLSGRRLEDTITQDDVVHIILNQRELNFPTGSRFSYSNSNYTLLALVVERVSGQSFSQFMAKRVFEPLGMTNSWIQDDFRLLRTGHAQPYGPGAAGFQRRSLPYSSYGATGLQTTVEDMARWAMNLDQPKVGTRAMIDAMFTTAQDGTGEPIPYASGFEVRHYHGNMTVEHSGTDPGYVANFLMLPEQHLAISILCNTEGPNPVELSRRVADLYLGDVAALPTAVNRKPVILDPQHLASFVGTYKEVEGALFAVTMRDGKLFMQDRDALIAVGTHDFLLANAPVTFSFPDMKTLIIHEPDHDRIAKRVATPVVPAPTAALMQEYAGDYYSPELKVVYTVTRRSEQLWLSGPMGETLIRQPPALLREADRFETQSIAGAVQFRRDRRKQISELTLSNGRVINLRLIKLPNGLPMLTPTMPKASSQP